MPARSKLLVIDVAALGWNLVSHLPEFRPTQSIFPAVTCPVQAAFRTATPPGQNGLVANGLYFSELKKVLFWEQSASLVEGRRIWEDFRARGKKVGMMFWQQSMGEAADLVVTPAPIHKHSGGMIQACYTQPATLEARINERVGRPFNLMNYWGPLANQKSSDWIVESTCAVMEMLDVAPDLLMTYIPHLDYDLQRYGPVSREADRALDVLLGYLERLEAKAEECGYEWLVFGDYAIEQVRDGAVFPNRCLREAGLFATRDIRSMAYTDFFTSRAFAVCDHGFAHVYCRDDASRAEAAKALGSLPGVGEVLDKEAQAARGIAHRRSGDLVITAAESAWFAYPWFTERNEAPDYASHVDIHNKPGYDPCELYFGWPPGSVSFDTRKIRGTHGGNRTGLEVAWASSLKIPELPVTQLDLARAVQAWMEEKAVSITTRTIAQRVTVAWDFPITFTHGLFHLENRVLVETLCRLDEQRLHRVMVFIDGHVAAARPALADEVKVYLAAFPEQVELAVEPQVVPGGEAIKNDITIVEGFMRLMLEKHMDRQSFIVIIGGGAVMDAVGLAAALVHRGLRQVRVPTTVLGQNDAGVGVKNGVNFMGGKNAIGTFAPPFAVLNDFDFLVTLPQRDWLCGVAEAWKVAIIRDREFFDWLTANSGKFPARDLAAMEHLVFRCAEEHLEHIRTNGDPFEFGRARPLDFGHWAAHKLELMSNFQISHGEAVAFGVLLDSSYAREKGWISVADYAAIERGLLASGFPLWHEQTLARDAAGNLELFAGLRDFREHLGGELCVTFPQGIGARFEVHEIDLPLMERCLNGLPHG